MDNFDAKFGPVPAFACARAPPAQLVFLGQVVVCVVLLVLLQPPFVMGHAYDHRLPSLCIHRVLGVSCATALATYVLHAAGTTPADTFRGACELLYRVAT